MPNPSFLFTKIKYPASQQGYTEDMGFNDNSDWLSSILLGGYAIIDPSIPTLT